MSYGEVLSPTSPQLSPTSPIQEDGESRRPMRMRRQVSRERSHHRSRSPYSHQPRSDLYYSRRSPQPSRYQYESNHSRGDYYRPESSFTWTLADTPTTQTRSSLGRAFIDPYRDPRMRFNDPWAQRTSNQRDTAWENRWRGESPLRRDPTSWAEYSPTSPTPSWDPQDRDYHLPRPAQESRTPSHPPSYERLRNARSRTSPRVEVEESSNQLYIPLDDRTPTPDSPRLSEISSRLEVSSEDSTDDELLDRHRCLIPLDDPSDQAQRDDLVRQNCKLTDPGKCYHLYTLVKDLSCPEVEVRETPRFMGTYLVPELGLCDADLWIRAKHSLHGIVSHGDVDGGYDFDEEYEDEGEGRICLLFTRREDAERIGLRYKVWTTEQTLW